MASIDNVQKIIEKSGNGFHYRVVNFLREKGWVVSVSPYYNDNVTDKPREVDIIAKKGFDTYSRHPQYLGKVNVQLFIECKYIKNEIVFWFDSVNKDDLTKRIKSDIGLDQRELDTSRLRFGSIDSVAKLFSSDPKKNQENDIIYKALSQSLNAMVYYKGTPLRLAKEEGAILKEVSYPVIVCSSFKDFHKVDSTKENATPELIDEDSFQLEVNYAYLNKNKDSVNEYFLVDIVNFEKFNSFIEKIEKDNEYIRELISWESHSRERGQSDTTCNNAI